MDFQGFEHWAFLTMVSGSTFMVYNAVNAFKTELKELSKAISGLREELAHSSTQVASQSQDIIKLELKVTQLDDRVRVIEIKSPE